MTDEQQAETAEKRGHLKGRKPKPPPVRRDSVHRGPHGYGDRDPLPEAFTHSPYEPSSIFDIDRDILDAIRNDHGVELLWVTTEVAGKPFPMFLSQRLKNHGQVVEGRNVFGGKIAHLCNAEGRYVRENMVLVAMPVEVCEMSRAYERRQAKEAISRMQASHRSEGVPVTGGNEEAARKQNFHKRSYAPFERDRVPD
jgi:hypothetical protein